MENLKKEQNNQTKFDEIMKNFNQINQKFDSFIQKKGLDREKLKRFRDKITKIAPKGWEEKVENFLSTQIDGFNENEDKDLEQHSSSSQELDLINVNFIKG